MTIADETVRVLAAGDCFGEIALLHNVPRTATVSAEGPVRLGTISRPGFLHVLGREAGADGSPDRAAAPSMGLVV